MSKKLLKRSLYLGMFLFVFSCPKGQEDNSFYDPDKAVLVDPNNDASDLSKRAFNGIMPFVVMKNIKYRIHAEVTASIEDLFGNLIPNKAGEPVNFDESSSFSVAVHQAKLSLDSKNMDSLMKNFTLNYADAPLKDLSHTISAGNRMSIVGKIKQAGIFVSFEMRGPINATPDGVMKLEPDYIKTAGIPVKSLLDLVNVTTGKLIALDEKRGLKLDGNAIIMYPGRLFPPPIMNGRVVRVETENNKLTIIFDDGTKYNRPALPVDEPSYKNYQHVYGGAVRLLGNETHENSNILMVDMDQSNPFDFYLGMYQEQSTSGLVKLLNRTGALINFMPDYTDVSRRKDRKPVFNKVDDGLADILKQNPLSNPKLTKQQDWNNQPHQNSNNGNGNGNNWFKN